MAVGFLNLARLPLLARSMMAAKSQEFILWTHLGLGDQISMFPAIESMLAAGRRVWLPTKEKNVEFAEQVFARLGGLELFTVSNDPAFERREILAQASRLGVPVVEAGHRLLPLFAWLYPDYGLNRLLHTAAFVHGGEMTSTSLRQIMYSMPQVEPPSLPYAVIDHHPGTWREIPSPVLADIRSRGLALVLNPREVPMQSIMRLLDQAAELHLVTSAPLCLAMTADARATVRIAYSVPPLLANDYPSWVETALPTSEEAPRPSGARGYHRLMRPIKAAIARSIIR